MTMLDRLKEFQTELCSVQSNEWANYTLSAWQSWFNIWEGYVQNGSLPPGYEHPPHRPNG